MGRNCQRKHPDYAPGITAIKATLGRKILLPVMTLQSLINCRIIILDTRQGTTAFNRIGCSTCILASARHTRNWHKS